MGRQQVQKACPFPTNPFSLSQLPKALADFNRRRFALMSNNFSFEALQEFEYGSTVLVHESPTIRRSGERSLQNFFAIQRPANEPQ